MPQRPRSKAPPTKVKSKALPPVYKSSPTPAPQLTQHHTSMSKAQWVQHCLWIEVKAPPPPKALCPQHTPIKRVTFQDQQPIMDILVKPPPPNILVKPPPPQYTAQSPKPPPPKPPPLGFVPPKHPPPQHHHLSPPPPAMPPPPPPAMPPPPPPLPTVPSPSAPPPHPSNPAVLQKAQHYCSSPPESHHSNPLSPYYGHWWLSPRLLHLAFPSPMQSLLLPRLQ